jgi:threonine/homoserine/homoserine lactone efflux protein
MAAMLVTFVLVSVALTLIPGPDMMFVIRSGLHGRAPAIAAALGAATAALAWGAAAAFGVAALLQHSARAFEIVRVAGAAYLIALGLRALWVSRPRPGRPAEPAAVPTSGPATGQAAGAAGHRRAWRAYAQGAGIDLLNPKTGLFYVAVLPQVIPPGMPVLRSTLLFAVVDATVAGALMVVVAALAAALLGWLRRPAVNRWLERVTGACMVGLGVRTALERA